MTRISNTGIDTNDVTSAVWGFITGVLSNQTDLQSALDLKIPLSYLDTDGTLTANSDTRIASQKATKTYADTKVTNPMNTLGDIIYENATPAPAKLAGNTTTSRNFLSQTGSGGASNPPSWARIIESDIDLSNVSTDNATTLRHGFLPILSGNASQFLNGQGNYALPAASIANAYSLITFSGQTSVNVIHNFGTYPNVQIIDGSGVVIIPLSITNNTLNDFTIAFSTSTSGSIISTVGSPQPQAVTVVSGSYTALNTDRIIKITASGFTITLPTAVGNTGREFNIDNASTGDITVNTTSSQTIEGELTQIVNSNNAMTVYSDGVNFRII